MERRPGGRGGRGGIGRGEEGGRGGGRKEGRREEEEGDIEVIEQVLKSVTLPSLGWRLLAVRLRVPSTKNSMGASPLERSTCTYSEKTTL